MLRLSFAFLVFLLAGLAVGDSRADQPTRASLKGVVAVKATITQTTPDAVNCGVDIAALLEQLQRVLREGGLAVQDNADTVATISFMVAHDAERGVCATSGLLGAYRSVTYFDDKAGWLTTGHVALWQRAMQSLSSRASHVTAIQGIVDRLGADLVKSWKQENAVN